jgi:hypothetical protein
MIEDGFAQAIAKNASLTGIHDNFRVAPVLAQPDPMVEDGFAQAIAKSASVTGIHDSFRVDLASAGTSAPVGRDSLRVDLSGTTSPVARDSFRVDLNPANTPTPVSATGSGRELEWPQLGIGFGMGIVLAVGLLLALRATRIRPLAH